LTRCRNEERGSRAGRTTYNPKTRYPTEWLRTLEKIDTLDVSTIVTGHGAPLHDKTLLHATMDVFRVLLREGKAAKERGLTPDQAKEAIFPRLHDAMVRIPATSPR
jgi:hypothetical protein